MLYVNKILGKKGFKGDFQTNTQRAMIDLGNRITALDKEFKKVLARPKLKQAFGEAERIKLNFVLSEIKRLNKELKLLKKAKEKDIIKVKKEIKVEIKKEIKRPSTIRDFLRLLRNK